MLLVDISLQIQVSFRTEAALFQDWIFSSVTDSMKRLSSSPVPISPLDLPERIQRRWPLNPYDRSTFYGGEERGYTDQPTYEESLKTEGHVQS